MMLFLAKEGELSESEDGCIDTKWSPFEPTELAVIENVYGWEECGKGLG